MRMHEPLLYLPFMRHDSGSLVDPMTLVNCPHCKQSFALANGVASTQCQREGVNDKGETVMLSCIGFFCSEACLLAFVPLGACGDA